MRAGGGRRRGTTAARSPIRRQVIERCAAHSTRPPPASSTGHSHPHRQTRSKPHPCRRHHGSRRDRIEPIGREFQAREFGWVYGPSVRRRVGMRAKPSSDSGIHSSRSSRVVAEDLATRRQAVASPSRADFSSHRAALLRRVHIRRRMAAPEPLRPRAPRDRHRRSWKTGMPE